MAAAALQLVWAGLARADAPVTRIGVVTAVRVNVSASAAESIATSLGEELRRSLVVDVVSGAAAHRLLPPTGLPDLCMSQPACVRDVAGRLGADELLFLVIVGLGDRVQIEVTWADARGHRSATRDAVTIALDGRTPARSVWATNARRLLPDLPPRPAIPSVAPPLAERRPAVRTRRRVPLGAWIAGGAAVAALAGGIGFGISAKQMDDELEASGCDRMTCAPARVDSLERRMVVADVLFGTAVVSATVAAILALRADTEEVPGLAATAWSDGAGLVVGGRF